MATRLPPPRGMSGITGSSPSGQPAPGARHLPIDGDRPGLRGWRADIGRRRRRTRAIAAGPWKSRDGSRRPAAAHRPSSGEPAWSFAHVAAGSPHLAATDPRQCRGARGRTPRHVSLKEISNTNSGPGLAPRRRMPEPRITADDSHKPRSNSCGRFPGIVQQRRLAGGRGREDDASAPPSSAGERCAVGAEDSSRPPQR